MATGWHRSPPSRLRQAFQQREGVLCFVFSRLRVVDEESERGKRRLNSLSFEDFLEAVVRVATMKVSTR